MEAPLKAPAPGAARNFPQGWRSTRDDWRTSGNERRQRDQVELPRLFRRERSPGGAVVSARADQRPHADVHQCRHGAIQKRLYRPREASLFARGHRAKMRARRRQAQRSRQCGLHRAPSHLLRDARQLLVRRLLQGPRHRARLEPHHQGVRPAGRSADGHRLRRRRPGIRSVEEDRGPTREQDRSHRWLRQFLADGRPRPLRPMLGNLLRPWAAHSGRSARFVRARGRPLHRDLEPGIHAVRAAARRQARRAAEAFDRHWHGARAHRRGAARHPRQLQDRFVRRDHLPRRRPDRRRARGPAWRIPSRHRRSPAGVVVPDCRRGAAVERGPRLRAPPHHASRHAPCQLLGADEPLMWRLVPTLTREMGQAYPELLRAETLITETLKLEETRFRKTLARGLALLEEGSKELGRGAKFPGEAAFTLYDTYGFPLDLTQDALKPRGIAVDTEGFNAAMERQREKARASWAGSGDAATEAVWFSLREKAGASEFLGYETETAEGVVAALVKDGNEVDALRAGESGAVVLNQTPFYAESGGQVGDTGLMRGEGVRFSVTDTQKKAGDVFVHSGTVEKGTLKVGAALTLDVDHSRRSAIRRNHSATHLLHEALRQVLGDHVAQKGSLVAPDRLRFDFSHPKPMTAEEIERVEDIANDFVLQNSPVTTRLMAVDEAIASGARALFGEKYGDEVRVVAMGEGGGNTMGWSVELCGGTHVRRTGDIGLIAALADSAVAAGVHRIEALTGTTARKHARHLGELAKAASAELKAPLEDMPRRLAQVLDERRRLERELSEAKKKLAMGGGSTQGADGVRVVGDVKLLARAVEGIDLKDLRSLADEGKKRLGSGVVAIVGVTEEGKAGVVVGVTADLTSRFSAIDLVRKGAEALGGKGGGGRADMAQAGGPDGSKAEAALKAIEGALGGG